MAAVLEPHRFPTALAPRRPDLRLLHGGQSGRPPAAVVRLDPRAVAVGVFLSLLVIVGSVAIGRGAFAGLAPAPTRTAVSAPAGTSTQTVVAQPGDSFWSIARRLQPVGDVRALVDHLVITHGSSVLLPGDRIVVPH